MSDLFNIYGSLATMASFYFKVPISIIVLTDDGKSSILSNIGLDDFDIKYLLNNDPSDKEIFEIPDIKSQPFFNNSYLKENNITYYLEAPLIKDGKRIGSLCMMDIIPKKLDESQKEAIKILTTQISEVIKIKDESEGVVEEARILSQFLTGPTETLAVLNAETFKFERVSKDLCNILQNKNLDISFLDILNENDKNNIRVLFNTAEPEELYEFEATIASNSAEEKYFKWKVKLKNNKIYLHGRDVTERRRIKSELIKNEERYKRLSEFSFESIVIHDNGVIIDCNPTFAKTFGYNDSEVIGVNIFHFLPRLYRKILKNESNNSALETLAVRKDSSTFPAEVIAKTIESDNKTIYSLSIRDNTERKKLENELLKSTLFQKAILDSSSFSIISTDFNGLIKTFNKGAEKMLQINGEDVIDTTNIIELYLKGEGFKGSSNHDSKLGFESLLEGLKFKTISESEWNISTTENVEKVISVTITTLKDNLGEISGYLFIGTDITDRKKAENENIEKSQILNGILSNMPVFIFKVDGEGIFTHSIGTGLYNMELGENELVGTHIDQLLADKSDLIKKAYDGEYVSFINSKVIESQVLYFQYYIFPDVSKKCGLIGFALDITERIISEQKLKESAAHLSKINKELDQFAYVVSHDLKAPLRAIANLSEWIEEDLGTEIKDDVKSNMTILRGRVFRMQNLIDGILSYSRVGRAKASVEQIDVNALVKEVISIVGVPADFKVDILKELPVVTSNSTWLEQIFSNLISNAVKYHDKQSGIITIDYNLLTDFHEFSVADDGPGISPEFHEKIFVIFQTLNARDNKESTGVGLAIVKKIIEEQGGSIRVESEEGKGAKFIFTIPRRIVAQN